MGYESKIYICAVNRGFSATPYANKIAMFDLCKMGYERFNGKSFVELFDKTINFDLYLDGDGDNTVTEDAYGDTLVYTTDIISVIEWLEELVTKTSYRRAILFLEFLKALQKQSEAGVWNTWNEITLVHYGY